MVLILLIIFVLRFMRWRTFLPDDFLGWRTNADICLPFSKLAYTLTHLSVIGIMKVFWGDVKRAFLASLQGCFCGCLRLNSCCMIMQEWLKVRLFAVKKWKCASLLRFLVSSKKTKKCRQDRIISFYLNSTHLLLFVPHRTNRLFNGIGNLFVSVNSLCHNNIRSFWKCQ